VADIFVSYTSTDREWAHWIGKELLVLGHLPHIHEWEIGAGDDIYAWMEARHDAADHVLCVISDDYLKAPYSTLERNAALYQAASKRPGFVLLVLVEHCRLPTLSDFMRHCSLYDLSEEKARLRFREFMTKREAPGTVFFPGAARAVSNIPIRVPEHFMGRDDALGDIHEALRRYEGRVAITALHGLRGVGKTTLAVAYAERHAGDYRATWWVRAQSHAGMRADLVGLGVRLGWVAPDDNEEPALAIVMERLRHEGDGILLIYDNAHDAETLRPFLPRAGPSRILVTSNAHAWRGVAAPVEIRLWPKHVGADYLIARTGRSAEREEAENLSEALGGLPLAHEQAAAYCERLEIPFVEYRRRFDAEPVRLLDLEHDAPASYHDRLTVAKTFALAIEKAARFHPAAESLLALCALLPQEPIPLFLFAEGRKEFNEPLVEALAADGLYEVVAALRAFALVDRETIPDERDPTITTDTLRLHRLVHQVAGNRLSDEARQVAFSTLVKAIAAVYPREVNTNPAAWSRARRLDALALAVISEDRNLSPDVLLTAAFLLDKLAMYRLGALAAFTEARPLCERALAIYEGALGPEDPYTAMSLSNLGSILHAQGSLNTAKPLFERALAIREKALGPEHPHTATSQNNLGGLLQAQDKLGEARQLFERALIVREKTLGPEHPDTAGALHNLASVSLNLGDFAAARPLFERGLAIHEKALGLDHPRTAAAADALAQVLRAQGDLAGARPLCERALTICERTLGPEHPDTAASLANLAGLLKDQGNLIGARSLFERALAIYEKVCPEHQTTGVCLNNLADLLRAQGDLATARLLFERSLVMHEKSLGPDHPSTGLTLHNLAGVLRMQGDLPSARSLLERALSTCEKALPEHPATAATLTELAEMLQAQGDANAAGPLYERALAIRQKALGPDHPDTATSLNNLASIFWTRGDFSGAQPLLERAIAIYEKAVGPTHPRIVASLTNLAGVLQAQRNHAAARSLLERALSIQERAYGTDDPHTADIVAKLAEVLFAQSDFSTAKPLFERALTTREKALGTEHPLIAHTLNNLAVLYLHQRNPAAARPLLERALAIHEKIGDTNHPNSIAARNNLAGILAQRR
jgi:tetratricopeptide (TPR) repeat protein